MNLQFCLQKANNESLLRKRHLCTNLTCFHFHYMHLSACKTQLRRIVKIRNCQSYRMLSTLTCPNWITSLYNSTTCKLKKENNFKKEKKGKGKNRLALDFFSPGECFSCCFNVDTVWLLLGFFLRISGSAWLKLDCLIDHT